MNREADLIIAPDSLDDFLAQSDRRGGLGAPDCETYWTKFSYAPRESIDQNLDPYSQEYAAAQIRLYEEIAGRALNQKANELTHFALEHAVAAPNAYNHPNPKELARHFQIL